MKKLCLLMLFCASSVLAQTWEIRGPSIVLKPKRDVPQPRITIAEPQATASGKIVTDKSAIRLRAVATGERGITAAFVNGRSVPLASGGKISKEVELHRGRNEITVSVEDSSAGKALMVLQVWSDKGPPHIRILAPRLDATRGMRLVVADDTVLVRGIATDESGVQSVTINDRPAVISGDTTFSGVALMKEGQNTVVVAAVDSCGRRAESSFLVDWKKDKWAVSVRKNATDYALLMATDDYDDWPRLVNPIADATALAEELSGSYGFQTRIVRNVSKDSLYSALRSYATRKYSEGDQLLIFFAGHGQFDDVTGDGYLVAKDSKKSDEIRTSYVSHSELRTRINNIPCKHIFLVVDACFGGTFDPLIAANMRGNADAEITNPEFINRRMQWRTRRYLTSGGKEYVTDGIPGQHTPFVRRLLEALRNGGGRDGILTISEVLSYLDRLIPEPRAGEFGSQEPGGDFLFIAR